MRRPPDDPSAYFDALWARKDDAREIERRAVRFGDGAIPEVAECHRNVDRWVSENPDHRAAAGWVIVSVFGDHLYLVAHSVVQDAKGALFDITLTAEDQPAPFLRHEGSDASFTALRRGRAIFCWPPLGEAG